MLNCREVESRLLESIGRGAPPELAAHLDRCAACGRKWEEWNRVWRLLDGWEEEKPRDELLAAIAARIRTGIASERASRAMPRPAHEREAARAHSAGPSGLGPAFAAAALSVALAAAVHYEKAARHLAELLGIAGSGGGFLESAVVFLVGCLYALAPVFVAGLVSGRAARGRTLASAAWIVAPFLLIALPYAFATCRSLGAAFVLSILTGLASGAALGGFGGFYLGSRQGAA